MRFGIKNMAATIAFRAGRTSEYTWVNENKGIWEGSIRLDYWMGFFEMKEPMALNIGGDILTAEINKIHETGYNYLIDNQIVILNSILLALYDIYPKLQSNYDYDEDEKTIYMPDIVNKEDFKILLKPRGIFILDIVKNDMPYIGFEFLCTWDDEHGCGVMTHNSKIVKIGGAETSFLSWIAEKDLNNSNST